ncbi:unknown [Clostridium sp. CAG:306]|nr:unknown [Clostridium sp. CAG:306]
MTKYIVKNCTSYHWGGCYYDGAKFEYCSKNDDCPIKQVVEKCLPNRYKVGTDTDILEILQVQEVE